MEIGRESREKETRERGNEEWEKKMSKMPYTSVPISKTNIITMYYKSRLIKIFKEKR